MERERIEMLYQKFGYVLSQKQFIEWILDTVDTRNKRITILRNQETTDFAELRKRIIKENHLHCDDRMEYFEFEKMHKKYAPNVPEYVFAQKVFDISSRAYANIKAKKGENFAHILLYEELPTDQEIEEIKKRVIRENRLHRKDEITYEMFRKWHLQYGGVMSEEMFAEKILDIRKGSLDDLRPTSKRKMKKPKKVQEKTKILLRTQMKEEEIE